MISPRLPKFRPRPILSNGLLLRRRSSPDPPVPLRRQLPFLRRYATTANSTTPRPTISRLQRLAAIKNKTAAFYTASVVMAFLGLTYAAVPLYRLVCQKTGWGGTPITDSSRFTVEHMVPVPTVTGRRIKISFSASTSDTLPWSFRPLQKEVNVLPGETALAFYKAKNKSTEDIIGIATYNVGQPPPANERKELIGWNRLPRLRLHSILIRFNAFVLMSKSWGLERR